MASSESPVRYFKIPETIQEAPVSPGCILEVIITAFLAFPSQLIYLDLLVIVIISQVFPARVSHNFVQVKNWETFGILSISESSDNNFVYV